jgi:CHASE2 domain-containing sensor protein
VEVRYWWYVLGLAVGGAAGMAAAWADEGEGWIPVTTTILFLLAAGIGAVRAKADDEKAARSASPVARTPPQEDSNGHP